jgi:hypothetical protein
LYLAFFIQKNDASGSALASPKVFHQAIDFMFIILLPLARQAKKSQKNFQVFQISTHFT